MYEEILGGKTHLPKDDKGKGKASDKSKPLLQQLVSPETEQPIKFIELMYQFIIAAKKYGNNF